MGPKSRRELLAAGFGAASAVLVTGAAAAAGPPSASAQLADRQRDLSALEDLMSGEALLQYCYTQVLESKALKTASMNVVLLAYGHEQSHALAVQSAISTVRDQIAGLELGLPARPPRAPVRRPRHPQPFPPPQVVKLFQHLHHEGYCITQLSKVESYVQSKYFHAVAELGEPALIRMATQILACKAQQWSLYQDLLSHGRVLHTVPNAEVRGSATLPK